MASRRTQVPKATREQVLSEFRHRCAICASDRPQLHHIDEDPKNHDPLNLLPLCPNCHLTDVHDPTRVVEPDRLRLFRIHRDPLILSSKFVPLYRRTLFLKDVEVSREFAGGLVDGVNELVAFVSSLKMGGFYAKEIDALLRPQYKAYTMSMPPTDAEINEHNARRQEDARRQMKEGAPRVMELVVELLRYQEWDVERPGGGLSN